MQLRCCLYLIAASHAQFDDPALVNAFLIAIVMSSAHLDNAKYAIFKCPLG